jgi:uncharacterized protein (TIGR00730 family)
MSIPENICVYCGSSNRSVSRFGDMAYRLGTLIARHGSRLIYGGGGVGLMRRVAEGCIEAGGEVTGIIPRHLHDRELACEVVQDLLVVDTMHERKMLMASRADAFIALPGGFGTLDELFEILTWRQLGLHAKPVILIDYDGYWGPLREMIARMLAEHFVSEPQAQTLTVVATVEEAMAALNGVD